jgi:hypothetical protein
MKTLKTLIFTGFLTAVLLVGQMPGAPAAGADLFLKKEKEEPKDTTAEPAKKPSLFNEAPKKDTGEHVPVEDETAKPLDTVKKTPVFNDVPVQETTSGEVDDVENMPTVEEQLGRVPRITSEMVEQLFPQSDDAAPLAGAEQLGSPEFQAFFGACTEEDKKHLKEVDDNMKEMKEKAAKMGKTDEIYSYFQNPETAEDLASSMMKCGLPDQFKDARNYSDAELKKMERENEKLRKKTYSDEDIKKMQEQVEKTMPKDLRDIQKAQEKAEEKP